MTCTHRTNSDCHDRPQRAQGESPRAASGGEPTLDHHIEEVLAALDAAARLQRGAPGDTCD
jgi:hypothetical protein